MGEPEKIMAIKIHDLIKIMGVLPEQRMGWRWGWRWGTTQGLQTGTL